MNESLPADISSDPNIQRFIRAESIFMPYVTKHREEVRKRQSASGQPQGVRFAHYTSADAALKILQTKRIWMRNTTCMADFREVQHGYDLLQKCFDDAAKREFAEALDMCAPGAAMQAINHFNGFWQTNSNLNIYIASVSEHDAKEDTHGRLSMWRAFGNHPSRVAIVIRVPDFSGALQALNIIFSPVAYLTEKEVRDNFRDISNNIAREAEFLRTFDDNQIIRFVFTMLFAGVTCLKHEGFSEEREWRSIYCPQFLKSDLVELSLETIAGVPQHIQKIPLDRSVSSALADIDLSQMLDRVIIGPSQYPWVLYQAFAEVLEKIGVPGARNRVFVSGIPIRS